MVNKRKSSDTTSPAEARLEHLTLDGAPEHAPGDPATASKAALRNGASPNTIAYLITGRQLTGKTDVLCRFIAEKCALTGAPIRLIDLDTGKNKGGSLAQLYRRETEENAATSAGDLPGILHMEVIKVENIENAESYAEAFWPIMVDIGQRGIPTVIDTGGADPRLAVLAWNYNVRKLAAHYNVELCIVFVTSADPNDWALLEALEQKALGQTVMLVFNEKHLPTIRSSNEQWEAFKRLPIVKRLIGNGAKVLSLPREDAILDMSGIPVNRALVGQFDEVSVALEPVVTMWRQEKILSWFRQMEEEFKDIEELMPW